MFCADTCRCAHPPWLPMPVSPGWQLPATAGSAAAALAWARHHSLPLAALADLQVTRRALDALALRLDGTQGLDFSPRTAAAPSRSAGTRLILRVCRSLQLAPAAQGTAPESACRSSVST